jgi:cytochrome c-type biogenesis protein CcmH/NrfF
MNALAAGSDVTSGAVLTLVLPVGCLLIVLAVWFVMMRRSHRDQ